MTRRGEMNFGETNFGEIHSACTEQFAELCSLATAGSLTDEESRLLEAHVVDCRVCRGLLADYDNLASVGMAKVGAVRSCSVAPQGDGIVWEKEKAKDRLRSSLENSTDARLKVPAVGKQVPPAKPLFSWPRKVSFMRAAAVLILSSVFAYQIGLNRGGQKAANLSRVAETDNTKTATDRALQAAEAEESALREKASADARKIDSLEARAASASTTISALRSRSIEFDAHVDELMRQNGQQDTELATMSKERNDLRRELAESETLLQTVRQQLKDSQDERQTLLLRSASLATQIDELHAQLRDTEESSGREQEFLASDRDIRELMGARQLYIADVFDIDSQGKTKKPFGRVFYTKGKSLVFYAFDLDQQPGYREAKAFQAWGRPAPNAATPVSLGIFYMDNEANRRWILKASDPKVLDQINSVFVTLEPKGGSKKPSNKPFLVAYLHSAPPNHP